MSVPPAINSAPRVYAARVIAACILGAVAYATGTMAHPPLLAACVMPATIMV
jgi:hypothetical protein